MSSTPIRLNYYVVGITFAALILVYVLYYSRPVPVVNVNLKELLSVSIGLSEAGGLKVREVKESHKALNPESKSLTKEGAKELKTDGDIASHRTIMAGFDSAFPELKSRIVSEEHVDQPGEPPKVAFNKKRDEVSELPDVWVPSSKISIWIDPLDATQEYTENLDQYVTVMICVAVDGKPVMGIINRPSKSEQYPSETMWAWVNQKHSENLVAKPADTTNRVIVSRSHAGDIEDELKEAFGADVKVKQAGGAGYKTVEVIRGNQDVYAHVTRIKKWDICPGHAMIRAVGGEMKTLLNEDINYDASSDPVNDNGLAASLTHVDEYIKKLEPIFRKHHSGA